MSQIKQTCSVTNGSQTVAIAGVDLSNRIRKNHIFMLEGTLAPYFVAADATYDGARTTVTLTGAYAGATDPAGKGVFAVDATYPDMIPTIAQGDVGTAAIFTQAMYRLQEMIASVDPSGFSRYSVWYNEVGKMRDSVTLMQQDARDSAAAAQGSEAAAGTSASNAQTYQGAAASSASAARAWATQEAGEVVVGQGYSARKHAGDAAASAGNAAASASAADIARTLAGISESNAAGSAGSAAASKSAAAGSESNAKTSERHAGASEDAARGSQAAAAASEGNAAASERAAAASAAAAKASETAGATAARESATSAATARQWATSTSDTVDGTSYGARKYAADAAASAAAASTSESAARTSEDNARASEARAAASESGADASKRAAAASEGNAKASETAAASSVHAAAQSEGNAAASEANALASGQAAAISADSAAASEASARHWAIKTDAEVVAGQGYGAKYYADKAAGYLHQVQAGQTQSDWAETDTDEVSFIRNKPVLAPVATSGNKADIGLDQVENKSSATIRAEITGADVSTALGYTPMNLASMGAPNGVASLGADGKVPAAQLPSFVDDVLEYVSQASFPATGESGKIYVADDSGKTFRWSGSQYVEISASPGSTDAVPEGAANHYFSESRVRNTILSGFSVAENTAAGASDSVLSALGKLQAQSSAASAAIATRAPVDKPLFTGAVKGDAVITAQAGRDSQVDIGSDGNGSIEIGKPGRAAAGTPFIDFHSSQNSGDFDVRMIASGGDSSGIGQGLLNIQAGGFRFNDSNVVTADTIGSLTAGWANHLQYARNINGVAFDGSRDITVHDSTKLPLTGGALSNKLTINVPSAMTDANTPAATVAERLYVPYVGVGGRTRVVMENTSMTGDDTVGGRVFLDAVRAANGMDYVVGTNTEGGPGIDTLAVRGTGNVEAPRGAFVASGAGGFVSAAYVTDARNPIWRFGNADGCGISYFHSHAGLGSQDTIGLHFGTPTADGSQFAFDMNGNAWFGNTHTVTKGGIVIGGGGDLTFKPAAGSTDIGDLVWANADGSERHRLWDGATGTLMYRWAGGQGYKMWHEGNLYLTTGTDGFSKLIGGQDLNALQATGFYRGANLVNAPLGNAGWWYVMVEGHDASWTKQVATAFGSGNNPSDSYMRVKYNGSNWTNWICTVNGVYGEDHVVKRRRNRYHPDDGTSINSVVQPETGFDYNTAGAGIIGPFMHFGGLSGQGDYGCQFVAAYNSGNVLKFRANNGDVNGGKWYDWKEIAHSGNLGRVRLMDGTDLNTLSTYPGFYAVGAGHPNAPAGYGQLLVMANEAHDTTAQIYVDYASSAMWVRSAYNWGRNWQPWKRVLDSSYEDVVQSRGEITGQNWNDQQVSGIYRVSNSSMLNGPGAYAYGTLVVARNGYSCTQTYYPHQQTGMWVRTKWNDVDWSPWRQVWDSTTLTRLGQLSNDVGYITNGGSYNWTAPNYFRSNMNTAGGVNPPMMVYSDNGGGAIMSFHRGGNYALNMGLDSDNVFRIGGWSAPNNLMVMDMSGNVTFSGNVTAYSDERKKTNWRGVGAGFMTAWAGVKSGIYDRIDSGETQAGLSAQSVREVLPEAVVEDNDGYLSLNYGAAAAVASVELAKELVAMRDTIAKQGALIKLLMEKAGY